MKKKIFLLTLIAVMAVSSLFAAKNVVFLTGSPWAKQYINTSVGDYFRSDYGCGAKVGYRHHDGVGLLGVDVTYQNYSYYTQDTDTTAYLGNLQLIGKLGGKLVLSQKVDFNLDGGFGINVGFSRVATNFNPMIAGSGSLSFYVNPSVAVVMGMDASLSWSESENSAFEAAVWNLVPHIGAEIDF